ncbi:papain family cysteine protease (macronuclear) [Tetrahymena thermophila SB210]|uniref:Papain family cysteine protease n=1 Tax=Tetrahymena thermophila (strain SB210) TaxID=312017 RepID=Q23FQ3_TETTS|nr:papain family cysteine protease [Tetrahymena thermophila SB210]EAR95557.1 papain family cysteine protease [Tetrahymena thermophila SB210]|eukprot:XP_001015802.1 papain family cysteine protease [Tetrahymena thermophila SB210]
MNKISFVLIALALISQIQCQNEEVESDFQAYNKWRTNNRRVFLNQEEETYRQLVFFENLNQIKAHQNDTEATYTVSLNQFSDYSDEEFQEVILNKRIQRLQPDIQEEQPPKGNLRKTVNYPDSVDWRNTGALTPVQNQGQCGSCAAFGTAGVLESFHFIRFNNLVKFSEQQLLDCARQAGFDADGCDGTWQQEYFKYAIKHGIVSANSYPYVGYQTRCKDTSNLPKYFPQSFKFINRNVPDIKSAISQGPISVTIDASNWRYYRGGIFNGCSRYPELNHAVIAVGYDAQGNYIIKNSWGPYWGDKGYITVSAQNDCGILRSAIQVVS